MNYVQSHCSVTADLKALLFVVGAKLQFKRWNRQEISDGRLSSSSSSKGCIVSFDLIESRIFLLEPEKGFYT